MLLLLLHTTNFNTFCDLSWFDLSFNEVLFLFFFVLFLLFYVIFQVLLNSSLRESRNKLESLFFGVRAIPCRRFLD